MYVAAKVFKTSSIYKLFLTMFFAVHLYGCKNTNVTVPLLSESPAPTPSPSPSIDSTTSFSTITNIGRQKSMDFAKAVAVQSDGKIVVAGYFDNGSYDFFVARYTTAGVIDSSFGTSGFATVDFGTLSYDRLADMAIQSDGKIILVGRTTANGNDDFAVARFNANGTIDTSFGTSGKVIVDIGGSLFDTAASVAVQSDGKIVVGGMHVGPLSWDCALIRLSTAGVLDATFGTAGIVITDIGGSTNDRITGIAIQGDGKIIAIGDAADDYFASRYSSAGVLDATFGTGGSVVTDISGSSSVDRSEDVVIQADGKIVVAGQSDVSGVVDFTLVRYSTTGTLDNTFGTGGIVITDIGAGTDDAVSSIALQPDGKLLVAGSIVGPAQNFVTVRYNTDGSLDATFGTGGKVTADLGGNDIGYGIALQNDGKVIVVGSTTSNYDVTVLRYSSVGVLDNTFATAGKTADDVGTGSDESVSYMTVQSDGKFLVLGRTNAGNADFSYSSTVTRYNVDGTIDTSFGTNGISKFKMSTDITNDDQPMIITLQSDGKIIAGGNGRSVTSPEVSLARLNTDGSLDATFGTGGVVTTDIGTNSWDYLQAIYIYSDGKILVGGGGDGTGDYDYALLKYNSNGTLDNTFGTGGKATLDMNGNSYDYLGAMTVLSSGKILVAGYGGGSLGVARFTSAGVLDATYATAGKFLLNVGGGGNGGAYSLNELSDGKVIVGGYASVGGQNDTMLVRLTSAGALDATFGTGGVVTTDMSGAGNDDGASLATVSSDGKILVSGSSDMGTSSDAYLVQYNSDGSIDTSFGTSGKTIFDIGTNSDEWAVGHVVQSNGMIVFCGQTNKNGTFDTYVKRVSATGQ